MGDIAVDAPYACWEDAIVHSFGTYVTALISNRVGSESFYFGEYPCKYAGLAHDSHRADTLDVMRVDVEALWFAKAIVASIVAVGCLALYVFCHHVNCGWLRLLITRMHSYVPPPNNAHVDGSSITLLKERD